MNKKLVIGNWKMNPVNLVEAKKIAQQAKRAAQTMITTETVICPPLPFIVPLTGKTKVKHFSMGAQNISKWSDRGAHTGEVSASMLKDLGVRYVIIGHSERRADGETDDMVAEKIVHALNAGLIPVVCVGELVRDEAGTYLETLKHQITQSFAGMSPTSARDVVLAYEPVWAIGATDPMKNEDIYEMSLFVKKVYADLFGTDAGVNVKVLYGGSVNYRNAPDIMRVGKVDGLLVGRESVNAPGFAELLKAVDQIK